MNNDQHLITFFLYIPSQGYQPFIFDKKIGSQSFKEAIGSSKMKLTFIHKCQIINPTINDFDCQRIESNDVIVGVSNLTNSDKLQDWKQISNNTSCIKRNILLLSNNKTRNEYFRIKDLKIAKSLNISRIYHKLNLKYSNIQDIDNDMTKEIIQICSIEHETDITPAEDICEDPLPVTF